MRSWVLLGALAVAQGAEKLAGIIHIVSDDLRTELGGAYGHPNVKTPNWDRLMEGGVTMLNAYCQYSLCSPSRTSWLTGLRPDTTRIWDIGPYFRDTMPGGKGKDVVTLPQAFKEAGWNVSGVGKVFHPGSSSGAPSGFSTGGSDMPYSWTPVPDGPATIWHGYHWCTEGWNGHSESPRASGMPNGTGCVQSPECLQCLYRYGAAGPGLWNRSHGSGRCDDLCWTDGLVAQNAVEQLRWKAEHAPDQPFFLAVGFKRPHLDFLAPQWAFDLHPNETIDIATHPFPPETMPPEAFSECISKFPDVKPNQYEWTRPQDGEKFRLLNTSYHRYLRQGYRASVSWMDSQLGRVLDELDAGPFKGRVAIIAVGDHGWNVGEHGCWCKQSVWENVARVPMIWQVPGGPTNASSNAIVEMLDIFPTLLEAAGVSGPSGQLEGKSLLPILKGGPSDRTAAFSMFKRDGMGCSVRVRHWRLSAWVDFDLDKGAPIWSKIEGVELYDHEHDTGVGWDTYNDFENVNLATNSTFKDVTEALTKFLIDNWDQPNGTVAPVPPAAALPASYYSALGGPSSD